MTTEGHRHDTEHAKHLLENPPDTPIAWPHASNCWIEIDAAAMRRNMETIQHYIADTMPVTDGVQAKVPEICSVIKGNAYGHGYPQVVPILEDAGVHRFAVFAGHEAMHAHEVLGPDSRLEIMGYVHPQKIPWVVANDLEPWAGTQSAWEAYVQEAERQEAELRIHIDVETGMNRVGLPLEDALDAARTAVDHDNLVLEGICSHFAGAEDSSNDTRVQSQAARFESFLQALADQGIRPNRRHIASSSAALLYPEYRYDQVRLGIASYGFWPTREVRIRVMMRHGGQAPMQLQRALSWKSKVMMVRHVDDGEYVGYGQAYEMTGDGKVAIIPVGYADGLSRDLSNLGTVLIHGRRCPIIGSVNMNMIQVMASHLPDIDIEDEVVLIGRQGDCEIGVGSFSDYNNIVNYELMTRISEDIPRIVLDDANQPQQ